MAARLATDRRQAESAGGTVIFAPMDVMTAGRMAIFMDTTGAVIAAWQPGQHLGAQLVNEPGAFIWSELSSSDPAKSKAFYSAVFGMTASTMDMGIGPYTTFEVGGQPVGGTVAPQMPGVPNHWHVYFGTDDADATAAKAAELGGSVVAPPFDTPAGRMAVLSDPQGAVFSIIKTAPQG